MSSSRVRLLYSAEDGSAWAKYVVELLQSSKISIDCVQVVQNGVLMRNGTSLDSEETRHRPAVVVFLASPSLMRTLLAFPSTRFYSQIASHSNGANSVGGGGVPQSKVHVILFLCGVVPEDFEERDCENKLLSQRFVGMKRWVTVSYEQPERLTKEVLRLLDIERKRHKTVHRKLDFQIIPAEVKCEEPTMVVISYDEPVEDNDSELKTSVDIISEHDSSPIETTVCRLNTHTVFFMAPPHSPGLATVRVFISGREIGHRSIFYHSSTLEAYCGVVQILIHQLSTVCDQMLVAKRLPGVEELDQKLSDVFQINSPVDVPTVVYEKFFEPFRLLNVGNSRVQLPTLIHLAAKYGLNELASRLIDLPDARYGYGIVNVDGFYPEHLARNGGHDQLGVVLENFRQVDLVKEEETVGDQKQCSVGVDCNDDDDDYVAPEEGDGIAQIYAAYRNATDVKPKAKTPEHYVDMYGGRRKKNLVVGKRDDEDEYVSADSVSDIDDDDIEYQIVTSPVARFGSLRTESRQMAITQSDDDEEYIDMDSKTANRPPKLPKSRPSKRSQASDPNRVGGLDESALRASASANSHAVNVTMQPLGRQDELLSILNQAQLEHMKEVITEVGDSSVLGSIFKNLGIGSAQKKPTTVPKNPADFSASPSGGVNSGTKLALTGAMLMGVNLQQNMSGDRSSTASSSSRDSRASTASSGIDVEFFLTSAPTPPVPPRYPPRGNHQTPLFPAADHAFTDVPTQPSSNYLELLSSTEDDSCYVTTDALTRLPVSQLSPPLITQKTLPEIPNPPLVDPAAIQRRKYSLPVSTLPVDPKKYQSPKATNRKSPALPPIQTRPKNSDPGIRPLPDLPRR